jgi:transcriptional regulator with XRE-family HTH domain
MKSIYSSESKQLAARLRKARLASGLSQEQAAKALRCTQSYISKVERGQLRLDIVQLKSLARLYRVSLGYLAD